MKKAFGEYTHLAGRGGRSGGSLWQGPDHLLYIESSGFMLPFSETYKRIDFRNIQTISHAPTSRGLWITIWLIVLLGLLVWGLIGTYDGGMPNPFLLVLTVIVAPLLVLHLIKGQTVVCKVQTAVQVLNLKPLRRLKKARAFVEKLEVLCREHQAGLAPSSPGDALPPAVQAAAAPVHQGGMLHMKQPWVGSRLAFWSLLLMALTGLACGADLFIRSLAFFYAAGIVTAAGFALLIASMARLLPRWEVPGSLKFSMWGGVAVYVLSFATAYGLFIFGVMQVTKDSLSKGGFRGDLNAKALNYLAAAGFEELGWAAWLALGLSGAFVLMALLGMPAAFVRRAEMEHTEVAAAKPPPAPPIPPPFTTPAMSQSPTPEPEPPAE